MKQKPFVRFHILYTLRFLKYALAAAVVPMVQLLFSLEWHTFFRVLRQSALILGVMGLAALVFWYFTACSWQKGFVSVRQGVVRGSRYVYRASQIAVVDLRRPFYCRLTGATRVTLYFRGGVSPGSREIWLPKAQAVQLADSLMPLAGPATPPHRHQSGKDRLAHLLLSTNVITTLLLGVTSARQIARFFGDVLERLQAWGSQGFSYIEQFFLLVLPTGAAVLATLLFLLSLAALLRAGLSTSRYSLLRMGGILLERRGLVGTLERRIRHSAVDACDFRTTPVARLLGRRPLHIYAGAFVDTAVPILVCKMGEEETLQNLLPRMRPMNRKEISNTAVKSIGAYVWLSGSLLGLSLFLFIIAAYRFSTLTPIIALLCTLCLGSLLVGIEGFFHEGVAARKDGGLVLSQTRFFTRHTLFVITGDLSASFRQHPLSRAHDRCNFQLYLPARRRFRVRGLSVFVAQQLPLTLPARPFPLG